MALMKFQMGDGTPEQKRKRTASTGGYGSLGKKKTYASSQVASTPITKAAQFAGAGANVVFTQPMFFSPLHTPQNWQIASKRREMYQWARFYYENEPKVAAGIDFYSHFPLNGFKLECKDKRILEFYEQVVEDLELPDWLNYISFDYHLLGDVFPFLEIECEHCGGKGVNDDKETCNHPDGMFKSIRVMNPDYIEVQSNVLADETLIAMRPDEELQMIVQRRQPKQIFDKLDPRLIELVATQQPIPLSNRSVSHIKHSSSGYSTYGTSLLRRLFTILAYKTKIMTANWIVAERMILPVRVVKIGDKDRPATEDDIQDVVNQLAAVVNDPNLTIVTHHAFDYEWYGACYDRETEILTPSGWKTFDSLNKEELVATYNQKTGLMEYEKPLEYHEYDYDSMLFGGMYNFKARGVDINVTPNHRMLVERNGELQEVYSQNVKHNDKLLSSSDWKGSIPIDLPYKDSPLSHLSLDEYLEFVGYYISEGGAKEERNKNLREEKLIQACPISQSVNSSSYDNIEQLVSTAYPRYSTYHDKRNNGCNLLTINSVDISRYLAEEFGTHSWDKKVPEWIRNLPKDKLKIIYDAMMSGDGDTRLDRSHPRHRYTTVSKQLSDDFSDICLKLGYWPSTSVEDNRDRYPNRRVIYRTNWSDRRQDTKFNIRKQHIIREDYVGKVYCVKVPNSWVFVRRNGKVAICGNTGKIHNISAEIELIGKEILDGMMLNQALLNGEMAGYNCHDEETLVLTDSGFKEYKNVTLNDKIGCYNPETKEIEYHSYEARHEFYYNGELIKFQTDKIDIAVTPNHRMWSAKRDSEKFEFIEAKDIRKRARFVGAVEGFDGNSLTSVQIGDQSIPIYQYCELAGFYVSEGSIQEEKRANRQNGPASIYIYQNKEGKARDQISNLFDNCFETHYETDNAICVYGRELANHFSKEYGRRSENKRLPSWLKNLDAAYLEIVINSMLQGDGSTKSYEDRSVDNYAYYTSSEQLANDFAEIAFKSGYVTKISKISKNKTDKKYLNKDGYEFKTNSQQYVVYISKGFKGRNPVLDSKSKKYAGKEIVKMPYKGKVWCFTVPTGIFVTMRNGKIAIQGNSAQVGVETMIRRLDNWRNKLKNWVEKKIFLPIAMMQGFVDEEKTERTGRQAYLYPKLKWNDLGLRDNTNKIQLMLQMYDKQLLSAQSILEEMDMDYDAEVEKMREEQVMAAPGGMLQPGAGGAMGGGMGGGPMGAAPSGPPPGMEGGMDGGMPGGDMGAPGMGAPPMGAAPMGGAPAGGGMGAAAGGQIPKVMKKGKGGSQQEAEQEVAPPQMIKLTKLEAQMYKALQELDVPYSLFGQYEIAMPGQKQPFVLDFAYPQIGVGIETDGAIWHEREDLKQRDQARDQKLANVGWRILRFSEDAVEQHMEVIKDVIYKNLLEAHKQHKAAAEKGDLVKLAGLRTSARDTKSAEELAYQIEDIKGELGYIINIGD